MPGQITIEVSAGRRWSRWVRALVVAPGEKVRHDAELSMPAPLDFEREGWFAADLFLPVGIEGRLRDEPGIPSLARAARAEGLSFVGAGPPWGPGAVGAEPEALQALAGRASGGGLVVAPAFRGSDAPMYGPLFHLGAKHPMRVAPVAWDALTPNFVAVEEARMQGALTVLTGVAGDRRMDPRSEILPVEPGLAAYYRDASAVLGEAASELPFLAVSGMMPDALGLSGRPEDEAVWFRLLEMGHRVPAVLVASGGSFAEGLLPGERNLVRLDLQEGARATAEAFVAAVRAGRVMASEGPFVFLELGGRGPGETVETPGDRLAVRLRAFGSTLREGPIARVELVRGGAVLETIAGEGRNTLVAETELRPAHAGWYVARAWDEAGRGAWTSPVYVGRPSQDGEAGPGARGGAGATDARDPQDHAHPVHPCRTRVAGRVFDAASGAAVEAEVRATLMGAAAGSVRTDPATGEYSLEVPAAARLDVEAGGYAPSTERVFFHTQGPAVVRSIHVNESGRGAAVLAEEGVYERMRLACAEARVDVALRRLPPRRPMPE
jgi:hypothetical protein